MVLINFEVNQELNLRSCALVFVAFSTALRRDVRQKKRPRLIAPRNISFFCLSWQL